jgi:hypothetical protein
MYCNVINASDAYVVLKKDQLIGNFSEVEIVNEKFNEDVLNFVPLDTKRQIQFPGKTFSSKPVFDFKDKPPEISTQDILSHDIKRQLKNLRSGKTLNQIQRSLLLQVLTKNFQAFQWNPNEIGRTTLVEHCIPTGDNKPIQQRQYPIPSVAIEHMGNQVADMLKKEFIRPKIVLGVK